MSACPKCQNKLRLIDIGQHCPHCGVNLRFYGFEERFYRDAKLAELSVAKMHIKLRVFKTSFIGGWLPKTRLFSAFLPLILLLLPACKTVITLSFVLKNISLNIIEVYRIFTDGTFRFISSMAASSVVDKQSFVLLRNAIYAYAGTAFAAALAVVLTLLCFISIKKMSAVLCLASGCGAAGTAAVFVWLKLFCQSAQTSSFGLLNGTLSYGMFFAAAGFAAVFAFNFLIAKNGLHIEYDEGDLERAEIAHKVKTGELNIDDLPQPIVETQATRAIDDEILKAQKQFSEKEGVSL